MLGCVGGNECVLSTLRIFECICNINRTFVSILQIMARQLQLVALNV